jgi:hypothetical protein
LVNHQAGVDATTGGANGTNFEERPGPGPRATFGDDGVPPSLCSWRAQAK